MADPIIEARHLVRVFGGGRTWWGARKPELRAVETLPAQPVPPGAPEGGEDEAARLRQQGRAEIERMRKTEAEKFGRMEDWIEQNGY